MSIQVALSGLVSSLAPANPSTMVGPAAWYVTASIGGIAVIALLTPLPSSSGS